MTTAPFAPAEPAASRRRWRGLGGGALIAVALALVAGACQPPAASLPPSPVEGVVVSVDAASLGDVKGFGLRTSDGAVYALTLGNLENATEFSPSHLAEHQATSSPIRAWYRLVNGVPTVYRLEDASG